MPHQRRLVEHDHEGRGTIAAMLPQQVEASASRNGGIDHHDVRARDRLRRGPQFRREPHVVAATLQITAQAGTGLPAGGYDCNDRSGRHAPIRRVCL